MLRAHKWFPGGRYGHISFSTGSETPQEVKTSTTDEKTPPSPPPKPAKTEETKTPAPKPKPAPKTPDSDEVHSKEHHARHKVYKEINKTREANRKRVEAELEKEKEPAKTKPKPAEPDTQMVVSPKKNVKIRVVEGVPRPLASPPPVPKGPGPQTMVVAPKPTAPVPPQVTSPPQMRRRKTVASPTSPAPKKGFLGNLKDAFVDMMTNDDEPAPQTQKATPARATFEKLDPLARTLESVRLSERWGVTLNNKFTTDGYPSKTNKAWWLHYETKSR
jgi:hypothetical protein